jgi:hypothetical protein
MVELCEEELIDFSGTFPVSMWNIHWKLGSSGEGHFIVDSACVLMYIGVSTINTNLKCRRY